MPVLDANALSADPQGLAFLRDALGAPAADDAGGRRFPLERWRVKTPEPFFTSLPVAPAPERVEPCFAEALA